ncbi:translocation protein SEC63 homolog [Bacillus rossius redtenbacheri]|uniref:translocation protein SEC63 homolog n=1 Tax=Bacillus rossius redtenbacheri TaxID=93214 RepID=UPI002FDDC267
MGGQKFQYDESGGTFFYFLLSFLALLLIPATYYWWPRKQKQDQKQLEKECQCRGCQKKKVMLLTKQPWKETKQILQIVLILSGWTVLILLAYKVSQFDYEYANFDPYEILGITTGASQGDIKKAYRKLSLIYHPDKETGDEKTFMKLTKAYQALTDDEARRNWEKYGNPDGPGAMSFGIALPSWIVEKENSVWVLGLYALVFMVALPTAVGMWWYRSIRYSGDQVLLDTTQMYYYFFHKTPCSMAVKRVIMILAASREFEKRHNSEVVERPTDNVEVPQLIKQIPNLNEKNREPPLCHLYSIKARALIHAHLGRIPLQADTLDKDRQYIVKKCPYLVQEMVNCVSQLILLAYAHRIPRLPNIETIENCMKLSPMIVQAMWEYKNPLLQLPHITDENLKYFSSKKQRIKSIQQFASLKHEEKQHILRFLNDDQFNDVIKVLSKMPLVDFQVVSEVIDDENPTVVTAGAIVTVTVTLVRKNMSDLFEGFNVYNDSDGYQMERDQEEPQPDEDETAKKEEHLKKPVWQKQPKKGKKSGKKSTKSQRQLPRSKKGEEKSSQSLIPEAKEILRKPSHDSGDESDISEDEVDHSNDECYEDQNNQSDNKVSSLEDDDTEWEKFQSARLSKREKVLEGRSKQSHSVHCPYFPEDKQEYWWVYVSDRKSHTLLTAPYHLTALVDKEEVQLKFTAPRWPNLYTFTVCLRSDSYLGFDQTHDIKLDVKEAPEVPVEHPQWDMLDDEEGDNEGAGSDVSEFTTDEDVEEDI